LSELVVPISNWDILRNVHKAHELPENAIQKHTKPRASGLMGDAREIAYMMAGVPLSDPFVENDERVDGKFTQEQGRLAENITADAINASDSIRVVNRQISLPEDFFVSGHPDGEVVYLHDEDGLINGLKFGWEHKHLGRYQYKEVVTKGILAGYPDIVAQALLYGHALGWDAAQLNITSQDASSMRVELRGKKIHPDTDGHPKMLSYALDLRPLYDMIPMLEKRAKWFSDWMENDGDPARVAVEAKSLTGVFPWGYSEYKSLAIADGPGSLVAPQTPLVRDWAK